MVGIPLWPGLYLHQFGVMPCVDYDSHHPLRVPELGATKQHLVWTEGNRAGGERAVGSPGWSHVRARLSKPQLSVLCACVRVLCVLV